MIYSNFFLNLPEPSRQGGPVNTAILWEFLDYFGNANKEYSSSFTFWFISFGYARVIRRKYLKG